MATSSIKGLTGIIVMMLFYSICVSTVVHFFPSYVTGYTGLMSQNINTNTSAIVGTVDLGVQAQSNIPLVEIGTLLFYTGNLFFDLILNFITALPQMFTLVINIFMTIFNLDSYFTQDMKLVIGSILFVVQMIGIIQLFVNLRGGSSAII